MFLGGFVFFEPAPYDLFLALLIPAWLLLGLPIPRAIGPLVVLMLLFLAGGVLAATQAKDFSTQPVYYAVTALPRVQLLLLRRLIAEDRAPARHDRQRLDRRRAGRRPRSACSAISG